MIPKKRKISRKDFPRHTEPKKVWNGVFLRINRTSSPLTEKTRFAVVVSKKISPDASVRNMLKRNIFDLIETEPFYREAQNERMVIMIKQTNVPIVQYRTGIANDIKEFSSSFTK